MKHADIAILPAGELSRAALAALWNQAYEGYFVPVAFDEQRFARHLRRANVELGLSRVLTAGGEPAGLSLVGRREARAYLAGFGIVRAQRRRGLARLLIEVQLAALPAAGVRDVVLEVIEHNPARSLYGQAGFEALRPLELLSGTLEAQPAEPAVLGPADLAAVHAHCSTVAQPTCDALTQENAAAIGVRRGDSRDEALLLKTGSSGAGGHRPAGPCWKSGQRRYIASPPPSPPPSPCMDNDEVNQLLVRIGREDQAAFRQLYKAFSQRVYAYALNMLSDHARAEEVLVDTLYEVWRHPDRFRGDSQFSTWLIGIARRKALMVYRARRPDEVHADLDDIAEVTASDTPDGYAELAGKQRREGVQHCMGKLSDEHRECLHLVFYEGMGLAEVAEIQNCPEGTVKTRLFHARQKIKKCLQSLLRSEGSAAEAKGALAS
ncbi:MULTISPECIES: GNAT family N-acetyltransferase [unclassified Variovorax]|uniref:GNAT family N-acetyltransferase n=1 Tax=unclassified Variovorax TaxID=663243 RepID=UPI00076D99BB|nr:MULTISPECIES: GNAT family N-acetyltransferase [unclassified Variovorax]KWT93223.1 RNA polymerase sigma-70 factor [Variovorax sp. WDL1]PNG47368.1 ECF RNA polymerase sigma factor SigK [Variovorax sp. B2]PNG47981.1 ECF RNA polymerase sigma factor SigK [Variovorax sp. B4]VTV15272.1 Sigma-K factor [Variovorax sp. WDL1]